MDKRKLLQARLIAAAREYEDIGTYVSAHGAIISSLGAALMRHGWEADEMTLALIDLLEEERKDLMRSLVP